MLRAAVLALAVCALLPASANALTFCVSADPAGTCPSGPRTDPTLQSALDAANFFDGRDRIEIAAGTLPNTSVTAFANNPVDIVGAGQSSTTIVGDPSQGTALALRGSNTISDLTVQVGAGAPTARTGLELEQASATRVRVTPDPGGATGALGVNLRGSASFTDSRVTFPATANGTAVRALPFPSQPTTLRNLSITGFFALQGGGAAGTTLNASKLDITSGHTGVQATSEGIVHLSSSIVRMSGASSSGLLAETTSGDGQTLEARHVTVIGDGSPSSRGVEANSTTGKTVNVNVRDSIVQGFAASFFRGGNAGTNNVSVAYSDFAAGTVQGASNNPPAGGFTAGPGNVDVAPGFRNAASGDYRLIDGSPLLDAGDPAALGPLDSTTDLIGAPRVADGNADGTVRSDMGAFELQRPKPPVTPPTVPPVTPPAKDTTKPVLSATSLSRAVFAVDKKSTALTAAKKGTTIRYMLSEAATVKLAIERRETGASIRKSGKRTCAKRTKARKRAKRCTRYVAVRTLTRKGTVGRNSVAFTGRLRGSPLKTGRYRMRLTATDGAGNRSAPRTLTFRVVR